MDAEEIDTVGFGGEDGLQVARAFTSDGRTGILLTSQSDRMNVRLVLTPNEARRVAAALVAHAEAEEVQ